MQDSDRPTAVSSGIWHRARTIGASGHLSPRMRDYVGTHFFVLANVALLAILVPVPALLLFFALAWLLVALRQATQTRGFAAWTRPFGIVILVLALLLYRGAEDLGHFSAFQALQAPKQKWVLQTLLIPIGISYAFLRSIYALYDDDVHVGNFPGYYFFFPTFFSGPIINPRDYLSQRVSITVDNLTEGLGRVLYGGVKFGLSSLLQFASPITHPVQANLALHTQGIFAAWVSVLLAGVWLYFNFSAFSDIAIGVARCLGYRVPENFDRPFLAADITEFWRRWHITLGEWLRVQIYNPLVRTGSRVLPGSLIVAVGPLLCTMLVCGLWHQLSKTFVVWGLLHGGALAVHEVWRRYFKTCLPQTWVASRSYAAAMWLLTHLFIAYTWAFFFPVAAVPFDFHAAWANRLLPLIPW